MANRPYVIRDKSQMRSWSRSQRASGKAIALVPTMGFLHQGHLSLINEAKCHADVIVVSIYVNPGQFAATEDLATYPSDLQGDLQKLAEIGGADVAFCPSNLYDYGEKSMNLGDQGEGDVVDDDGELGNVVSCLEVKDGERLGHESWVRVEGLEKGLCGRSRPIFFRGVATVVTKLFNIVEPDVAVFGKKDYQQWRLIVRMHGIKAVISGLLLEVRDLDFGIKVVGSEIVREADGLAMSSRNVHLSSEGREKALSISRSLLEARALVKSRKTSCDELKQMVVEEVLKAGGQVDYVEIVNQETLMPVEEIQSPVVFCVAAWFGEVRLIDNVEINV